MESKTDISSYTSHHQDNNQIPSIHVEKFMLQQHSNNLNSLEASRSKLHPHIFTVAQTLKDPFILKHIKPDYGSLSDFIGDSIINRDLLHQKKRKNEPNDDENEENIIKALFQKKNQQQLNNIYLNYNSTALQKKIAGKMMVENIFQEAFGVTLGTFKTLNVKTEPVKNYKINLDNIDQIFMGKKQSSTALQLNNEKKIGKIERKNSQQQKSSKTKRKQSVNLSQSQRMQIIEQLKSRYPSMRKLQIRKECTQYKKLQPKKEQQIEQMYYRGQQQKKQNQLPSHTFQISETKLQIQKLTIKPELMLYLASQFQLDKVETIILNQIRIKEEVLCFMVDIMKAFCIKLNKLHMGCISLEKSSNLSHRIKQLLQVSSIKQLSIEYMDIETKQFCVICLGIGSNTTLENRGRAILQVSIVDNKALLKFAEDIAEEKLSATPSLFVFLS